MKTSKLILKKFKSGFTIIEVIVSLMIFSFLIPSIINIQNSSIKSSENIRKYENNLALRSFLEKKEILNIKFKERHNDTIKVNGENLDFLIIVSETPNENLSLYKIESKKILSSIGSYRKNF